MDILRGMNLTHTLLVASGNRHKLEEIRTILAPCGLRILGAAEVGGLPEVIEDGLTFCANAVKKAREVAVAKKLPALADDSGLEVVALAGRPGVFSARYAGQPGDDAANNRKLLADLAGVTDRRARFVCVIALALPDGRLLGTAEGEVRGRILEAPRGTQGFGYDPLFLPDGGEQTFAELAETAKHQLSHRGNALRQALATGLIGMAVKRSASSRFMLNSSF